MCSEALTCHIMKATLWFVWAERAKDNWLHSCWAFELQNTYNWPNCTKQLGAIEGISYHLSHYQWLTEDERNGHQAEGLFTRQLKETTHGQHHQRPSDMPWSVKFCCIWMEACQQNQEMTLMNEKNETWRNEGGLLWKTGTSMDTSEHRFFCM